MTNPTPGPYPFLPRDYLALLLEKDSFLLVFWTQSREVTSDEEGPSSVGAVDALRALVPTLRGPKLADVVRQLEGHGYRYRGMRRFNFRSGELFQDAHVLVATASEAGERHRQLSDSHGGTNPPLSHDDWREWELVTLRRNAACKGARVLGLASLEAFVNEILLQRSPELYRELEEKNRAAPFSKLKAICESLAIPLDQGWARCIEENLVLRRQIVHHRPGFVDDSRDGRSIEPSEAVNPQAVAEFLGCVQEFFVAVFDAYGVEVPPTHLPPKID